ncbi:HD domain-containing protein [Enterococcus hirae]|uniref:HD domain-containing protein n=1 Tax=Enterococcus hirae TaxID=1354 RepID=UPI002891C2B9|nr:HD domain-containing protein [Enterococcus hirae]EMF0524343.1 HD domain-containing protein [Enterococcus hirae]MDT2650231.1 HD domain-containing protein [Enterococcus hirae]
MEKLQEIADYSFKQLAMDQTGHGIDHTVRVVKLAEKILATEPQADPLITLASAYLHDTIDDKVVADETKAKAELHQFLQRLELSDVTIESIFLIIENLSFSKGLSGEEMALPIEGKIVQDADRLEALGAIGILRTAYFGGGHGHPIFDESRQPITYQNKKDYRKGSTVINHFYEKLFLLPDRMNTPYGIKEAKRREAFMREFIDEFFNEWSVGDPDFTPESWLATGG